MSSSPQTADDPIPVDDGADSRLVPPRRGLLERIEPGASLMRHKRLVLLLFSIVSLIGFPIAYFKGEPTYYTQAAVYISPRLIKTPQGGEEFQSQSDPQYRAYVLQNARTIRRFDVAQETLKRLGANGQGWWRGPRESDRRAAERLASALEVTPAPESYQMIVGLRGERPEGLTEIVNTLLDVYIGVQKSTDFYAVEGRLAALRQEEDSLAKELPGNEASIAQLQQTRKRQESLRERLGLLDLESKAPAVVRVFAKAEPAVLLKKDRRAELALIVALAGIAMGLALPVAIDVADPRVSVPADAGRAVGFDALGWLPERTEGGEEFTWELILRLARRMDTARRSKDTRVWMFTSVKTGGGTTTLVNSLGKALTMLGVPSLAVEANASRADGRYARNCTGSGLSALLRGRSTLSQSIEPEQEEMPDHIPVGELDGAGHLPDIHRLAGILDEAAQSYAMVLVDLPPLLDSLDAEYVVRRAGCVVLIAEARKVTTNELKRAAHALESVRPKTVACVVNRVHSADGGGFAQDARREFETAAATPMPGRHQPWLWK